MFRERGHRFSLDRIDNTTLLKNNRKKVPEREQRSGVLSEARVKNTLCGNQINLFFPKCNLEPNPPNFLSGGRQWIVELLIRSIMYQITLAVGWHIPKI